jgi:hypothetical protein
MSAEGGRSCFGMSVAQLGVARARHVGLASAQIEGDGCRLLNVVVHGIPRLSIGPTL